MLSSMKWLCGPPHSTLEAGTFRSYTELPKSSDERISTGLGLTTAFDAIVVLPWAVALVLNAPEGIGREKWTPHLVRCSSLKAAHRRVRKAGSTFADADLRFRAMR
jgi:hypothetical protein